MSLHEYLVSQELVAQDIPFYALIMATMRRADNDNLTKLQIAFPEIWRELKRRHRAPGGVLGEERYVQY